MQKKIKKIKPEDGKSRKPKDDFLNQIVRFLAIKHKNLLMSKKLVGY